MIILRSHEGKLTAELHSQQLRGYNGISSYMLNKPELILSPVDGSTNLTVSVKLYDGWVGGDNLMLTPVRNTVSELAASKYNITFMADEIIIGKSYSKRSIEIPLLQNFVWSDL